MRDASSPSGVHSTNVVNTQKNGLQTNSQTVTAARTVRPIAIPQLSSPSQWLSFNRKHFRKHFQFVLPIGTVQVFHILAVRPCFDSCNLHDL